MNVNARLVKNPIEVGNRLNELFGLRREDLLEVVEAMVSAKNSCTDNDPPSAPGFKAWSDGTRRLREIGLPKGWERNNDDFVCSIFDAKRGIKIAVCNTDGGTGWETSQPQNRNKKGAATDRAVSSNKQSLFNDMLEEVDKVVQLNAEVTGITHWYLCVFCDGDVVLAELSCPSDVENGFFKGFSERIILIGGENEGGGVRLRKNSPDGGDSELEIKVTRRQA